MPPTPPPDFHLETWNRTLDEIERRKPARLALTHFGVVDGPEAHLEQLRARLSFWTADVAPEDEWLAKRAAELRAESGDPDTYEQATGLQAGAPASTMASR
jgi:hypothetical protein